ncbi:hypothetical protein [Flavobacterium sp. J27]|uniref:hypothetical protein n=1 Tax=Flavobacterium sp. J27 TaxID=2060419 RepID=UPI00102FE558|nr:hypothetical protein [Flavobacterium sp. J27]
MISKKETIVKFSITALVLLVLLLFFGYRNISVKYDKLIDQSNTENRLMQNQFDEILRKYDSVTTVTKNEDSSEIRKIIDKALVDSREYRPNPGTSSGKESKDTDAKIAILKAKIADDSEEIIAINNTITHNKKLLGQLESDKKKYIKVKHENLNAINLNVRGVKILSDLYTKSRNRRIQQIRVCFTLEGNEFVRNGNKDLYIQVVNPKNQIISVEDTFLEQDNIRLVYSAKTETMYNKKDIDVCTYVDLEAEKTIKGKYIINIYNSFCKIGTTIFEYE